MTKVLFMGRKPIAAEALHWLSARSDLEIVGVITDSHLEISPTRDMAISLSIPLYTRESVESAIISKEICIDLGVSILYWQKIRKPVIDGCTRGVINFHPAPLPTYKGTAGYNLAILEKLSRWGVSAHYVDEHIDNGPIIEVEYFLIDEANETAQTIEAKSQLALARQIKRVLSQALDSKIMLESKKLEGGKYISRSQMEAMKVIVEGDDVDRKVRAFWFPPYDGANITIDGVKYTLVNRAILGKLAEPTFSAVRKKPLF